MSMPSTILSDTTRSTFLRPSLAASTGFFCSWTVVEKAARGAVDVKLDERAAMREMFAMRRKVISVRKDILAGVFGLLREASCGLGFCSGEAAGDEVEVVKILGGKLRCSAEKFAWMQSVNVKNEFETAGE